MKIEKIRLYNFMRYKGEMEINFSCDDEKNVTVILGDNTFGKTTIAQAFRWGLYGRVKTTNYTENIKDIVLLNREVISGMSYSKTETVRVEIFVWDNGKKYEIVRSQEFRKNTSDENNYSVKPEKANLLVRIDGKEQKSKHSDYQSIINELFPENLSDYLFFDGERWSASNSKAEDIENSINLILGIKTFVKMMDHLKDGSDGYKTSVISKIQRNLKTTTDEEKRLKNIIVEKSKQLESNKEKIDQLKNEQLVAENEKEHLREILDNNKRMEDYQNELKNKKRMLQSEKNHLQNYNSDIAKMLSKSDKLFASELLPRIEEIISQVDIEGKDIPGVTSDTIDWLLENKICLCGENLVEGDVHYNALKKLREEVYPNKIGGPAKALKAILKEWQVENENYVSDLHEKTKAYDNTVEKIDNTELDVTKLETKIDERLNLQSIRQSYNDYARKLDNAKSEIEVLKSKNRTLESDIEKVMEQIEAITKQDKENAIRLRALEYAKAMYERAERNVSVRKNQSMEKLNEKIKNNFEKMFNGKEKYAKLGKDYKMHMYYQNGMEERTLSEGEITAINFVYIVSILELAKEQGKDAENKDVILNLPLVLDAPFSKLGNENIGLISKKLPMFAEQVIIFMLDKDWEASNLDKYTLPEYCYRVTREYSDISSSVESVGGKL